MKNTLSGKTANLSRRKFIVNSAAAGGGLALGLKLPFVGSAEAATAAGTEINVWVAVKPDSTCVVRIARSEMGHGTVTAAAAKLTPPDPKSIQLKDPKQWKIAGKPMKRLDTADKLNGRKIYAIDLKMPGMLNAAVKASPVHGGKLVSYDDAKVMGMPGVQRVVKVHDNAVAVVADTWWRAQTPLAT